MDPHTQGIQPLQQGSAMEQDYYYPPQGVAPEKGQATGYVPQEGTYVQYQDPQYYQQTHHPGTYGTPAPHYVVAPGPGPGPADGSPGSTILGTKKAAFLAVMAIITILLALVIGLGAGLGVSLHNRQSEIDALRAGATAAGVSGSVATTVFVTVTGSPTKTSSSASASATPTNIECPRSNNTFYTSNSGNKRFQKFCGIDYSNGGADDLGSVKTKSMDACIDACANKTSCTGCGWGSISNDEGDSHSCWLKTNLTKSHNATSDWEFAVLTT